MAFLPSSGVPTATPVLVFAIEFAPVLYRTRLVRGGENRMAQEKGQISVALREPRRYVRSCSLLHSLSPSRGNAPSQCHSAWIIGCAARDRRILTMTLL